MEEWILKNPELQLKWRAFSSHLMLAILKQPSFVIPCKRSCYQRSQKVVVWLNYRVVKLFRVEVYMQFVTLKTLG